MTAGIFDDGIIEEMGNTNTEDDVEPLETLGRKRKKKKMQVLNPRELRKQKVRSIVLMTLLNCHLVTKATLVRHTHHINVTGDDIPECITSFGDMKDR